MRIKDALNVLKPKEASYAALRTAYQDYQQKYPEEREDLLAIGRLAFEKLIEADVYWFCDFDTLQHEIASAVPLDEVIDALYQKVSQWPGCVAEINGIWLWVSGNTDPYKDQLEQLGFQWSQRKKMWYWRPATETTNN